MRSGLQSGIIALLMGAILACPFVCGPEAAACAISDCCPAGVPCDAPSSDHGYSCICHGAVTGSSNLKSQQELPDSPETGVYAEASLSLPPSAMTGHLLVGLSFVPSASPTGRAVRILLQSFLI